MTMIASGSHHFQAMCSSPAHPVCPTISPAQVSRLESASNPSTANSEVKEQQPLKDTSRHGVASELTTTSLAFVYGTLKRGFGNYRLIEEQINTKHCRLVGTAQTKFRYPLVCGPFQVPFLLDVIGRGEHVRGELYQVDTHCLGLLDELEGISKGHYVRCPVTLTGIELDPSFRSSLQNGLEGIPFLQQQNQEHNITRLGDVQAEAYFAAMHYTSGLYQAPHIEAYTEKESATYTRRMHRPQHRTFIEHVYHWIDEQRAQRVNGSAVKTRCITDDITPFTSVHT